MTRIEHPFELHEQTPAAACGPTTVAMQLSALGVRMTPEDVVDRAHAHKRPGDPGYTAPELACFCRSLGLEVELHAFDGRVLDHAWSGLSPDALDARLQELCAHLERGEPAGSLRMRYALSYRRLLRAGGVLRVAPFVTSVALRALLADGPVHAGVAASVITTEGKTTADGAHDPHAGAFGTHSVLVYGYDNREGFLVADPAPGRGRVAVGAEHLLAAITAAQVDDDDVVFRIMRPS